MAVSPTELVRLRTLRGTAVVEVPESYEGRWLTAFIRALELWGAVPAWVAVEAHCGVGALAACVVAGEEGRGVGRSHGGKEDKLPEVGDIVGPRWRGTNLMAKGRPAGTQKEGGNGHRHH